MLFGLCAKHVDIRSKKWRFTCRSLDRKAFYAPGIELKLTVFVCAYCAQSVSNSSFDVCLSVLLLVVGR